MRGLVDILDQLSKNNVAFQSAIEPVDMSSAVGRMLIQMLGVFAQFEREILIDRVINAMERKPPKENGVAGESPMDTNSITKPFMYPDVIDTTAMPATPGPRFYRRNPNPCRHS